MPHLNEEDEHMTGTSAGALTRRTLLAGTVATSAVGMAACRSDKNGPGTPNGKGGTESAAAQPPAHVPFEGVTPDLPGTADGVIPGFFSYPDPPIERGGYPLSGIEPFSALMQGTAPNVAPGENKNYKQFNDQLGTESHLVYGAYGSDYTTKLQTTIAGGDIPDFAMVLPVAEFPTMLDRTFSDLTDVLAGDNINKYPALANIPTSAWQQVASVNGRIFGVPQPRPPAGVVMNARGDLLAERGVTGPVELSDGQDLIELMEAVTDHSKGQFAFGANVVGWLLFIIQQMVGTPNNWAIRDGKFVHEYETEEMRQAISITTDLIKRGVAHPNSFSDPGQNRTWFEGGVTSLYIQGFTGWGGMVRTNPEWNLMNIELPKWDGGGMAPIRKTPPGYAAFVAIKKSDDDRLDQLLRVADYIASPFGTKEYLEVNYGVEGYSYEMADGAPTAIPDSPPKPGITYLGGNSGAVLFGEDQDIVTAQHDYLSRAIPNGADDASLGLYSEAATSAAASFTGPMNDTLREVIQERKTLDDWDEAVERWRKQVGDTMRAEYEAAAQE